MEKICNEVGFIYNDMSPNTGLPASGDISERMIAAYSRHIVSQLSAKGFYNIMQNLHLLWRKVISLLTWC